MRQFFLALAAADEPRPGDRVTLDPEESHHLLGVLRAAVGSDWCLVDGHGRRLTARLCGREGRAARLEVLSVTRDAEEAALPRLVLACAVVKGRRFEWALEKAVELGAHTIIPLRTERGVIDPGAGKQERWRGQLRPALKQAGRCLMPELTQIVDLDAALALVRGGEIYCAALPAEAQDERLAASQLNVRLPVNLPPALAVFVGPEGGWTTAEVRRLTGAGARALDLGPHVLRTETAALVGLSVLQQRRRAWAPA